MRPVEFSEIRNIAEYEKERKDFRPRMMALKERRRVRVGGRLTFLFENRETVRYQIQEMMRIERMVDDDAIRHEVETYNELVPRQGELSASLLIEYETPELRQIWLPALVGLERHLWMEVAGQPPSLAQFDNRQIATDRISSVQYIKFPLTPAQQKAWSQGVRIFVDHPKLQVSEPLTSEQIAELAGDLE